MAQNFSIIGGDLRQIRLANSLYEEGKNVTVYGFDTECEYLKIPVSSSIADAIKDAEVVILPLPALSDSKYITAPLFSKKIEFDNIVKYMKTDAVLFGGRLDTNIKQIAQKNNISIYDYYEREEFAILNAAATSEGAIAIAINETPSTLLSSKCMVTGFGRIGKLLCNMLKGMGVDVSAAARSPEALSWIEALGYNNCHIDDLENVIENYDIIFNTIPQKILNEKIIKNIKKDALIIDLASKPGGVDLEAAKLEGIKTIWALSLPGRFSPVSAGDIIKQTILNICTELEV